MSGKSPRGKHKAHKSGVPMEDKPVLEGWLARESTVVDRLLNKRFGALYRSAFVTYRKETDEYPSKTWPINNSITLSPVQDRKYHVRHAKTSTLWAVATAAYDTKHMWGFTVAWAALVGGPDKLTVAFETKEDAEKWHSAFTDVIHHAGPRRPHSVSVTSEGSSEPGDEDTRKGGASRLAPSVHMEEERKFTGTEVEAEQIPTRRTRAWASVLHINGISVYVEEQDKTGDGGAIMVSAVVHAPPGDVFKNLVRVRTNEGLGVFAGAKTVETIDNNTQVVAQTWKATGILSGFCAPREMVLLRTWRKDEDGTYIVLYQSTTHSSVPIKTSASMWHSPVRVQVQAAGFTIAPLLPQYTEGRESQESLVTLVLKADLGGFLSNSNIMGKLLAPVSGPAIRSILEPVVSSIVTLRDRVEQNRFVVQPLSVAVGEEISTESRSYGARIARDGKKLERTSTMLVYGALPLAEIQRRLSEHPRAADSLVLDATENIRKAREAAITSKPKPALPVLEESKPAEDLLEDDAWAIAGTCPREFWSSPGACGFKVRGPTYLSDRKKIAASPPMFELVAVDLLQLEEPMINICHHLPSVRHSPAPFLFCVQMMVPSSPPVSLVSTWASPTSFFGVEPDSLVSEYERAQGPCPDNVAAFFKAFTEFVNIDGPDSDRHRNARFKLIPNISKGSWIIKQSVGTTPVILGQKLRTKYFRGTNYFEVDVDIGASSVAASITNLVCGATKTLALDMGVLIEGKTSDHLPEQLAGTIRLDRLDLKAAAYFDESTNKILRPESFL